MFRPSVGSKEIAKDREQCCILANDCIHAVILVFSISSRFSEEEENTLEWLQLFFGERIVDYMILVFTGVDLLKKEESFFDYQRMAPPPLKTIIQMCRNRVVPFNNKTYDKNSQLKQLFHYVDTIMDSNRGKPYSAIPQDNKVETKLERLNQELAKAKKEAKKQKDKLDTAEKKVTEQKNEIDKLQKKLDQECCCAIL